MRKRMFKATTQTVEEILPGIDEYLRVTLAGEKLSEDAFQRRNVLIQRMDDIRECAIWLEALVDLEPRADDGHASEDDVAGHVAIASEPPVVPPRQRTGSALSDRGKYPVDDNSRTDYDNDDWYEPIEKSHDDFNDDDDADADDFKPCTHGEGIKNPPAECIKPPVPAKPPYLRALAAARLAQHPSFIDLSSTIPVPRRSSSINDENVYDLILDRTQSVGEPDECRDFDESVSLNNPSDKCDSDNDLPPNLPERPILSWASGKPVSNTPPPIVPPRMPPTVDTTTPPPSPPSPPPPPPPLPPRHVPVSKHPPNLALPPIPNEESNFAAAQRQISRSRINPDQNSVTNDEEEGDYDSCDEDIKIRQATNKNSDDDDDDEFKVYEIPEDPNHLLENGEMSNHGKAPSIDDHSDDTSYEEYDENRSSREDLLTVDDGIIKHHQGSTSSLISFTRFRSLRRSKSKRSKERRKDKSFEDELPADCSVRDYTFSGELTFRGKLTWSKRFCVLAPSQLVIYKSERDSHPQFIVNLEGFDLEYIEHDGKRNNVIRLSKPGCKTYLFTTDTQERAMLWIEQLSCAATTKEFAGIASPLRICAPQNVYVEDVTGRSTPSSPLIATPSPLSEKRKRHHSSQNSLSNVSIISSDGEYLREPPSPNIPRQQKSDPRRSLSSTLPPQKTRRSSDNFQRRASQIFGSWGKKRYKQRFLTASNIEDARLIKSPAFDNNYIDIKVSGHINIQSISGHSVDWVKRFCRIKNGLFQCFRHIADDKYEFHFPLLGCEIQSALDETSRPLSVKIFQGEHVKAIIEPCNTIDQGKWISALVKETGIGRPLPESSDDDDIDDSTSPLSPRSMSADEWVQRMSINSYEEQLFLKESSNDSSSNKEVDGDTENGDNFGNRVRRFSDSGIDNKNNGYNNVPIHRRGKSLGAAPSLNNIFDKKKEVNLYKDAELTVVKLEHPPYAIVDMNKKRCSSYRLSTSSEFEITPMCHVEDEILDAVLEISRQFSTGSFNDVFDKCKSSEPCGDSISMANASANNDSEQMSSNPVDEILDPQLDGDKRDSAGYHSCDDELEKDAANSTKLYFSTKEPDGRKKDSGIVECDDDQRENDENCAAETFEQCEDCKRDEGSVPVPKAVRKISDNVFNYEQRDQLLNLENDCQKAPLLPSRDYKHGHGQLEHQLSTVSSDDDYEPIEVLIKPEAGPLLPRRGHSKSLPPVPVDSCTMPPPLPERGRSISLLSQNIHRHDSSISVPPPIPQRGLPPDATIKILLLKPSTEFPSFKRPVPPPLFQQLSTMDINDKSNSIISVDSCDCKTSEHMDNDENENGFSVEITENDLDSICNVDECQFSLSSRKISLVAPIAESELSDHDYDEIETPNSPSLSNHSITKIPTCAESENHVVKDQGDICLTVQNHDSKCIHDNFATENDCAEVNNKTIQNGATEFSATCRGKSQCQITKTTLVDDNMHVVKLDIANNNDEISSHENIKLVYADDAHDDDNHTFPKSDTKLRTSSFGGVRRKIKKSIEKKPSICSLGSVSSDILSGLSFEDSSDVSLDRFSVCTDDCDYDAVELRPSESEEDRQYRLKRLEELRLEVRTTKREIVQLKKLRLAAQNKKVHAQDIEVMQQFAAKYDTLDQLVSKRETALESLTAEQKKLQEPSV